MNSLCTQLPDLPATDEAGRVFFASALRTDWCHDHDMDDLHDAFSADGIPYTVQVRPPLQPVYDDGPDPREALLTPWARNSFMR